ncbi:Ig-like domain-containing protein [Pontibacter cellulosilyticus]|uniref:Ig-like domain-containing protein n=1 Tax=Pontibacter cellulosilyticus TaxID=1720253 RepID=A0A923NA42_9BACT|nr:Ig-like domain-containing domain [Pontibacter cellulosilyticus]MBC5994141.1 Ig-like domain-containing protein [Pontibacter cellulosilyticus]
MKLTQKILILSTAILAASCASVSAPEGGPKDETPPTLVSSNPKDQQLNVSTKVITLTFDEEVQQNKLNSELLITPNTDNRYKVKNERNVLKLEFEKPLQENTTYTLNFRDGITDITEKNKAANLKLSFSTGAYIDSSKVSGTVVDLLTQKPQKEAIVALYPTTDTLSVRKNKPYYQTQTDAAGKFELTNIKEGQYRIYALADKNNNAFYDNEEEKIGYLEQPITITASTQPVTLELVKIDTKKPILNRRENYTDRFTANYNEGIKTFKATTVQAPSIKIASKIIQVGKAAELFKTAGYNGGKTILTAVDSAGNIAVDTLEIKFEGKRAQRIKGAQRKVVNTTSNENKAVGSMVVLELETPIAITGKEPVSILADTTVIRKLKYPEELKLDSTKTEVSFKMPSIDARNKRISLLLDSTAIKPIEGGPIKFVPIPITLAENGGVGSVKGTVDTKYKSYTIQLLGQDDKVVKQVTNLKTFDFKNISPGTYKIRVLIDENNNGKWEAGDPEFKRKPEKVYLYDKSLEVRANWEMEGVKLSF